MMSGHAPKEDSCNVVSGYIGATVILGLYGAESTLFDAVCAQTGTH